MRHCELPLDQLHERRSLCVTQAKRTFRVSRVSFAIARSLRLEELGRTMVPGAARSVAGKLAED